MKLLYLNEHLSCLNYQMNSDVGFSCQQLEENEVYRIDNSRSSCTLFMIEGEVIFDLGKYKGLRILQNQMVFIPQSIGTRMKSIIGSRCMLLFWDKNVSVCDKLFLGSLSVRGKEQTADNFILPVRKPLAEVLDSVGMYLEARLLCKHMHLLKQQELLLVLKGFYTKKELTAFFSASTGIRQRFEEICHGKL